MRLFALMLLLALLIGSRPPGGGFAMGSAGGDARGGKASAAAEPFSQKWDNDLFLDLHGKDVGKKKAALQTCEKLIKKVRWKMVPDMLSLLEDPDEEVRLSAVGIFNALGPITTADAGQCYNVLQGLTESLSDASPKVRTMTCLALGSMGPRAAPATPSLAQRLKAEDAKVRRAAASGLGLIGPGAAVAVPALIAALDDPDQVEPTWMPLNPRFANLKQLAVSHSAAVALGEMGPKAKAAVPALLAIAKDKGKNGRLRGVSLIAPAQTIAREGVTNWNVSGSVILSGGPVRPANKGGIIANSTIISASTVEVPKEVKQTNSIVKQNQPDALGPVHFFEPAEVGIEVDMVKNAVQVKNLDAAKSFAKAGLKAGDVLLALDKAAAKSPAEFRKQLRHSLAGTVPLIFEVRRAARR